MRGGTFFFFVFFLKVSCGTFFWWLSAQFLFLLEEKFTAPSVLHAVDRLGREAVVTTGSTHSRERERERLTFKGEAESAGRKRAFNRAGIQRRRIIKL